MYDFPMMQCDLDDFDWAGIDLTLDLMMCSKSYDYPFVILHLDSYEDLMQVASYIVENEWDFQPETIHNAHAALQSGGYTDDVVVIEETVTTYVEDDQPKKRSNWNLFKFWRKDEATGQEVEEKEPFGLRIGAVVEVETLELRILADKLMFDLSFPTQRIEKISHITLDDGVIMHRYYGGEVIFQITTVDGAVDQVQMFEEIHELHPDDWAEWLGEDGHIGAKTFEIDEVEFQRAWQEEPEGPVSPMELEEEFDGTDKFYEHKCMMYARWLDDNSESVEWLMVTAEDRGTSGSVKFLLGVDLATSQFRVTS